MAIYYTVNRKAKYHDYESKEDVINYILNPFKTPRNYIGFINVDPANPANPALSMHECSAAHGKDKGIQIRHFIVSFERNEINNCNIANAIANELMCYIGNQYSALYKGESK
jgi:hypothetical protein